MNETGGSVDVLGVGKTYGQAVALDDVTLHVEPGEFMTLLGSSGSGKSTLLNVVAGFTRPTSGSVTVDGRDITHDPPYKRDLGMVFQHYALFPHMSVAENVAFPLRRRRVRGAELTRRVDEALDVVELGGLRDRRPAQLSGGQQQRVALARAIVFRPRVLLMDEPLGALDKRLREQLQLEIKRLHTELGITFVFVTHDQDEALTMSDRIALLRDGRVVQVGTPADLYDRPASRYVAEFLGESNLLPAANDSEALLVRPQDVRLSRPGADLPAGDHAHDGKVTEVIYLGSGLRVEVELRSGGRLIARTGTRLDPVPRPDDEVVVHWRQQDCVTVPA
ncbi:putative spermidine/putrescine transport system ATP-binding protein [Nonomuraea maritima]|uniref:Putative spermidine/putrescine transport system ATP-binding protein n=1 Tax=Nonomuraea maritima TaxID=683260 RepID=A0A1G8S4S1_9ACTN|nr:ABC transporter ATP-binding protein [Nonomuraea maritima]SDJ24274.1 putative spermidine/putrescine transport system ATP-binding protein [Nonomuraea maritima]